MIKNNLDCTIHHTVLEPMGRYIILKADIEDTTYLLINVYAPNKDKDLIAFFEINLSTLKNENLDSEENTVMGGEFNCPLNPAIDKKGGALNERKSVTSCIRYCLQNEFDLVDIWRIKNPGISSFTWSQKSPRVFAV